MRLKQVLGIIDEDSIKAAAKRYDSLVAEELKPLDHQRYEAIPAIVAKRKEDWEDEEAEERIEPYVTRDELITLMQWKLKHGTFRPRLLDLIKSNSDDAVRKQSAKAFKEWTPVTWEERNKLTEEMWYTKLVDQQIHLQENRLDKAFQHLKKLNGVGPATASLMLSVYDPHNIPFFADELARWTAAFILDWDEDADESEDLRPHPCWKKEIKYTIREYYAMNDTIVRRRPGDLRFEEASRLGIEDVSDDVVSCIALEKAAWVFCREDGLSEATQESKVEQEDVFRRKAAFALAGEDPTKMKRFQGRPKRKSIEESEAPASGETEQVTKKKAKTSRRQRRGSSYEPL